MQWLTWQVWSGGWIASSFTILAALPFVLDGDELEQYRNSSLGPAFVVVGVMSAWMAVIPLILLAFFCWIVQDKVINFRLARLQAKREHGEETQR